MNRHHHHYNRYIGYTVIKTQAFICHLIKNKFNEMIYNIKLNKII